MQESNCVKNHSNISDRQSIILVRHRNTELPPARRGLFWSHLHMVGKSMRKQILCTEVAHTMRESLIRWLCLRRHLPKTLKFVDLLYLTLMNALRTSILRSTWCVRMACLDFASWNCLRISATQYPRWISFTMKNRRWLFASVMERHLLSIRVASEWTTASNTLFEWQLDLGRYW